jgi:hypothetical protein
MTRGEAVADRKSRKCEARIVGLQNDLFLWSQFRQQCDVGLCFREVISLVDQDHAFEAATGGGSVVPFVIKGSQQSEHCSLGRFVAELDVMFRGVVETALGFDEVALVEKALAHLAVGNSEALFVSDHPVIVERPGERRNSLLPLLFTGFLQREVVIENAERTIIVQRMEEVQRFEVIGAGLLRMIRTDVEIAKIDEGMGDGMLVALRALDRQHVAVASLGRREILHERAGVAEITKRVGQLTLIVGCSIVRDRRFPGRAGLGEIAAMEKDPRAMFIFV